MFFEFLYSIDKAVFLFFNAGVANPVFDAVMPFITEEHNHMIVFLAAWVALMVFGGKKGRIVGVLVLVVVGLSDCISSSVIKPLVGRQRPCDPDVLVQGARFLLGNKSSFSFPSSHAANNVAWATLFSVKYPRMKWVFIGVAVLMAYSRVYVGVHYPSDLMGGAVLGILCAVFVLFMEKWIGELWKRRRATANEPPTGGA